jgi:hypothetical protein
MALQLSQANFGLVGQNLPEFKPAQGGTVGAGAMMGADIAYKNALAKQAGSASQMAAIQSAVAKQGLTNDVISSAKDEASYQQALKSLRKLGVDMSDVPENYDAKFVGSKQMQSSHYLELLKAQAGIQMTQLQRDMQANDVNIKAMTSGLPAPYQTGQQLPAAQQLASLTSGSPQGPQMTAPMQGQAGTTIQGQTPAVGAESAPTGPGASPAVGLSNTMQPIQGAAFPGQLEQQRELGKQTVQDLSSMEKDLNKASMSAPDLEARFRQAKSASEAPGEIPTGLYTERLREALSPGASQLMNKAGANALMANLQTMTNVRPSIFLEQTLMKGLPSNATQPEVNKHISDEGITVAKWAQQVPKAFQALKAAGVTNVNDMENAIIETRKRMQLTGPDGFYHPDNMDKMFPAALNSVITGKAGLATQSDIEHTAKQYGVSTDQVIKDLKAKNFAIIGQ